MEKEKPFRYFKQRELDTKIHYKDGGKAGKAREKKNQFIERATTGNQFHPEPVLQRLRSQEWTLPSRPCGVLPGHPPTPPLPHPRALAAALEAA